MKNDHYDLLIVGAGLYGATIAQKVKEAGWLFLGAESACPMKRKSPVRRQEIMHVLSPKGGEAARRL